MLIYSASITRCTFSFALNTYLLADPVHCVSLPPAQVPKLCESQAAWSAGSTILLQALFLGNCDAGIFELQ